MTFSRVSACDLMKGAEFLRAPADGWLDAGVEQLALSRLPIAITLASEA